MNDGSGGKAIVGKLPQLFHAERVDLRIFSGVEIEKSGELLRHRAAGTLGEDGDLGANVDARFVVGFALA